MTNHPSRGRVTTPSVPNNLSRWLRDRELGRNPKPEKIRKTRQFATMTQREMAERMHVSLRTVEAWEAGTTAMHPNQWLAWRCACHVYREQSRAGELRESTI